jgi:hypothetical protein
LCNNNEDHANRKLHDPMFLKQVRKDIAMGMESSEPAKEGRARKRAKYSHDDAEFTISTTSTTATKSAKKKKKVEKKKQTTTRLVLDKALEHAVDMQGWSAARKSAYSKIDSAPNAYYYRFNKPGEKQAHGKWTDQEKKIFLKKLQDCKLDPSKPQWGLFSMGMKGRVGYQCANFYRKLVQSGEINDATYLHDKNGNLKKNTKSKS